jgi:hypothetical protein
MKQFIHIRAAFLVAILALFILSISGDSSFAGTTPVVGARVTLSYHFIKGPPSKHKIIVVGTTTTDAKGNFSFSNNSPNFEVGKYDLTFAPPVDPKAVLAPIPLWVAFITGVSTVNGSPVGLPVAFISNQTLTLLVGLSQTTISGALTK